MKTTRRRLLQLGASLAVPATCWPGGVQAQQTSDYPQRPVKIVVPFAAGGGPDLLARKLAQRLADWPGHAAVTLVVENIVGAGGILAAQNVARMAPDGYNLLLGASSHVAQKAMQPSVRFDPVKDFVHITRTAFSPSVLVVAADSRYASLNDLLAAARQSPGRLNYASGGVGSAAHLCAAALLVKAGVEAQHVPYKGSVEIVPSIIAGDTQFAFPIASTAVPQLRTGRVRALAVTSARRMPALPAVPTLVELLGSDELALDAWFGLWAPAGTPAAITGSIFRAVTQAHADASLLADVEAAGSVVALSASPAEFTAFVESESQKFQRLVKAANLSTQT